MHVNISIFLFIRIEYAKKQYDVVGRSIFFAKIPNGSLKYPNIVIAIVKNNTGTKRLLNFLDKSRIVTLLESIYITHLHKKYSKKLRL